MNKYFSTNKDRIVQPTKYAINKGIRQNNEGNSYWWFRSPGNLQLGDANIDSSGSVDEHGTV